MNQNTHTVLFIAIHLLIIGGALMPLMDWYLVPAMTGFVLVTEYLQSTSDNYYLDITNYDEQQIANDFQDKFIEVSQDERITIEEAVVVLRQDIDDTQNELFDNLYAVMAFQFSPLITLVAVIYFHVKFWSWVSRKVCKLLKINPDGPKPEIKA